MAIKLYYHKTTFQLITIDDGDESLIVGDDGSKVFEFYFGTGTALVDFVLDTTIPLTYEGRVIFERADGDKTNEVYLTPIAGGFYRYVIGDWVTAVYGDLKITTRLKLGAVATNFGIATITVEDGVAPDDGSTVSQAQYDAVMGAVNEVIIGVTPIVYDNSTSGLAAVDVQGAIDEVDDDVDALTVRVTTAETDIDTLEGRTTALEDTIPATYETIVDANIVRGRVTAVENGKEDVVDANAHRVRTTALETANMVKAPTWDPATGVITFPLFDGTNAYIDLPTELIFDTVVYDEATESLIFTLQDNSSFSVPIGDILTGMATQQYVADNYYNKTQLNAGQLDTRYYTESEVNNLLQERVNRNLSVYTELLYANASKNELVYVYDIDDETCKKMSLTELYKGESNIINGTQDIDFSNTISGLTATTVKGAIDEIDGNVDLVKDRVEDLETFQNTTVPATYEIKADATTHKARTTTLENANMVKAITRTGDDLITLTFFDNTNTTVITLAQLKTFIGEATNALSGLMTAQHVTDLEMLMALFDGDGDAVVNTIAEVLAIFENYPEGVDLVTALAGKVDKNNAITAGTKTKITYDAKGLVTAGADLVESDIPPLSPTKITQDTTNRFVTDTEKSTWNAKQSALGFTPENQTNKKTTLTDSDVDYPTTKAVKDELIILEERITELEAIIGGSLIGYVDENNNIILVGGLADETYTVKYKMDDDSLIDIGELVLTEAEPTNFFVVDGDGYLNPGRASSTGEDRTDVTTALLSNYIEVQNGDTIYVDGMVLNSNLASNSGVYNSSKSGIAGDKLINLTTYFTAISFTDNGGQFTINNADVGYIRISGEIPSDLNAVKVTIKRNGEWL